MIWCTSNEISICYCKISNTLLFLGIASFSLWNQIVPLLGMEYLKSDLIHISGFNYHCLTWIQCFVEKMNFQASMHQTEKTLKYAIRQKGPHPPNSSLKQAAQKQLTTKKRREGRGVKKGMHFLFLAWIFSTKLCTFEFLIWNL